ncbi:hypothetical protein V1291_005338 [Nitrobacteraceae bacterium AZCC 1564]
MMRWGKQSLLRLLAVQRLVLSQNAVGAQFGKKVELSGARGFRAMIGEIDDLALSWAIDGAVWLVDETLQAFRMPVVAARLSFVFVHALLHHGPLAVIGDEEPVQIRSKPSCTAALSTFATKRLARVSLAPSKPMRSPSA